MLLAVFIAVLAEDMATALDCPEVVLLLTLLSSRFLCRSRVVILLVRRVLQLDVTAGTNNNHLLLPLMGVTSLWTGVTSEAGSGRRRGLKVRLGGGLTTAMKTKAISLVVELRWVVCEGVDGVGGIGIHVGKGWWCNW